MKQRPPFLAGQDAFDAGEPIDANPFPKLKMQGPDYPGPYENWRAGWVFAERLESHTKALDARA